MGSPVTSYVPGAMYDIQVTATTMNGWVIGANPASGNGGGGDIFSMDMLSKTLNCNGKGRHLTNNQAARRTSLTAMWTTPTGDVGPVTVQVGTTDGKSRGSLVSITLPFSATSPTAGPPLTTERPTTTKRGQTTTPPPTDIVFTDTTPSIWGGDNVVDTGNVAQEGGSSETSNGMSGI